MGDTIKKIGIKNDAGQYTYTEIGVDANNVDIDNTTLDQKISTIEEDITKKVDKVEGKGLSSNDFTDEHLSIVETMSTGNITTGVKGDAETEYRIGNVNLTPENIGALPVDGNAASATKAEQDSDGNVITKTYAKQADLPTKVSELENDSGYATDKELKKTTELAALNKQTLGYGKKNLLKNTATSTTNNGITFTVNYDGSIEISGSLSSSSEAFIILAQYEDVPFLRTGIEYIVSRYTRIIEFDADRNNLRDTGNIAMKGDYSYKRDPNASLLIIRIQGAYRNEIVTNTIYPMIRSADIEDGTYEPYVDDVDTRLDKIDNSILNTLEEITANTKPEMIAGALALKELYEQSGGVQLGYTSDGKPGYYKAGADTVTPFSASGASITGISNVKNSLSRMIYTYVTFDTSSHSSLTISGVNNVDSDSLGNSVFLTITGKTSSTSATLAEYTGTFSATLDVTNYDSVSLQIPATNSSLVSSEDGTIAKITSLKFE